MSRPTERIMTTQGWVDYLSDVELPVLANTLRRIDQLTESDSSTVNELADVILNDAQLTSQVLRLSNSAFYNHTQIQVSTVSRSITLIGFDAVKSMAISSLLVDTLIARNPRPYLLKSLARALHAAVQARCLLPGDNEQAREEVFIGALMTNIGELAFWSCPTEQASELAARLPHDDATDAQKEVLGTTFVEITRGLVEAWRFGSFIRDVVSSGQPGSKAAALVRHSVALAREAEKGWRSEGMDRLIGDVADTIGGQKGSIRDQVRVNAGEAENIAVSFGIPQISELMPGRDGTSEEGQDTAPTGDPDLQLSILREISATMATHPDLNDVCQMVVEGIHRAVGMRRVVLLMADRSGQRLVPRKVLGKGTEGWREAFSVALTGDGPLSDLLSKECRIFQPARGRSEPPEFDAWVGARPALTGPVLAGDRLVGLFYADNAQIDAIPGDDQLTAFSHFVQQTQLCLTLLSRR